MGGVCHRHEFWTNKTYPAYLPLAHILEFSAELAILSFVGKVGYCQPNTLFPTSPGLAKGCKGDLELLRPTSIFTVPLILERIKKLVIDKVKSTSRVKQVLFEIVYNVRAHYYSRGFKTPILNALFFKKLHKLFGGKLEYGMIGGALLSRETEEFVNVCFGRFKQAYGTTELCGGATFSESS